MQKTAVLLLAGSMLAAACGKNDAAADAGTAPTVSVTTPPPPTTVSIPVQGAPLSFAPIAKAADPGVVTVNTVGEETVPGFLVPSRTRKRETKGLGTGFIIDKDGTILTNNHVVENAKDITVKLSNDRELPGKIVGRDQPTDIAVIKIDMPKDLAIVPLTLGDSEAIDVGDWVVAIGNPFGLNHTVSAGIVSAKGRTKEDVPLDPSGYYDFLQTDASINPGNSGGPLLNLKGDVIGINSAIRGGGAQGIGFAIPINMVKQLLPMLMRDGHITRSALGIRIRDAKDLTPEDKQTFNITDEKGTVVEYVQPGGPADKAGLEPGDVIVSFDGKPVERGTHLQWMASTAGVGKTIPLKISRKGKQQDVRITLGQLPDPKPQPH